MSKCVRLLDPLAVERDQSIVLYPELHIQTLKGNIKYISTLADRPCTVIKPMDFNDLWSTLENPDLDICNGTRREP